MLKHPKLPQNLEKRRKRDILEPEKEEGDQKGLEPIPFESLGLQLVPLESSRKKTPRGNSDAEESCPASPGRKDTPIILEDLPENVRSYAQGPQVRTLGRLPPAVVPLPVGGGPLGGAGMEENATREAVGAGGGTPPAGGAADMVAEAGSVAHFVTTAENIVDKRRFPDG